MVYLEGVSDSITAEVQALVLYASLETNNTGTLESPRRSYFMTFLRCVNMHTKL